ncbi:MAG: mechanosensitive ion channel family protein [Candidatus Omnitrophota bacterium]|nr:MAG: mechanosensitive ion channel family protein [Candidatus Omnitrophota bacterium]
MLESHYPHFITNIAISIGTVIFLYLIQRAIVFRINRRIKNIKTRHNYRKLTFYTLTLIACVAIGFIWIGWIQPGVVFSIIGAGVVISLGDAILSFFGWLFIIARRPFEVGERVQIGEIKGDVVDIKGLHTVLLEIGGWVEDEQSTGRIVNIPNNVVFRKPIYNYTKGFDFIWNEVKIIITFESNYKHAKEICIKYLNDFHNSWAMNLDLKIREAQNTYAIYYDKLTPIVYVKVVDSGILLSLRYLVEPHKRRYSENFLAENILDEFTKAEDINFAYTTFRITK